MSALTAISVIIGEYPGEALRLHRASAYRAIVPIERPYESEL